MLATETNLSMLCQANVICADGTFDCVSHLYEQLFTLHIFMSDKLIPVFFCLMASKSRDAYVTIFKEIKRRAAASSLSFTPQTIMSDFESGLISAIRDEFPNAQHQGCYFNYTQVQSALFCHYFISFYFVTLHLFIC